MIHLGHKRHSALVLRYCTTALASLLLLATTACAKADQTAEEQVGGGSQTASTCTDGQVALVADHIGVLGTIELLFPIMDTDGYNRKIHDLSSSHCLPRDDLEKLFKEAVSNTGEAVDILIAYDPKGTPQSYRPRFSFEADIYETEAPPPSMPPGDMKFGEAKWDPRLNQFLVTWYPPTDEWFEQFAASVDPIRTGTSHSGSAQSNAAGGFAPDEQRLIQAANNAWVDYRNSVPGAYDRHSGLLDQLIASGVCWGRVDEFQADYDYHRCDARSIQKQR